jgi:amino-acid N-acetyltransferase
MLKIEKATVKDVKAIHDLISTYSKKGFMLYRPTLEIEYKIRDYFVCRAKNKVVGCVALRVWNKSNAEIYALAVNADYTGQKIGTNLIKRCIHEAKALCLPSLFTLTFKQDLFMRLGFKKINLRNLPRVIFTEKTVNADKAYGMKL